MAKLDHLTKSLGIGVAPGRREQPRGANTGSDRRAWMRVLAEKLPDIGLQLASGLNVRLIDLARGGARFECTGRLVPGSKVTVRLVTPDATLRVPGRVVRSSVARIEGGVFYYDAAVAFDESLKQQIAELDSADAPPAAAPVASDRAASAKTPTADLLDDADLDSVLTMTAVVSQSADSIIDVLGGNVW